MTAKNRVTINLEDDEYQKLQKLGEQNDRSLAWLGRRAICNFLVNQEAQDKVQSSSEEFVVHSVARLKVQ